jgi:hypothetical protein
MSASSIEPIQAYIEAHKAHNLAYGRSTSFYHRILLQESSRLFKDDEGQIYARVWAVDEPGTATITSTI